MSPSTDHQSDQRHSALDDDACPQELADGGALLRAAPYSRLQLPQVHAAWFTAAILGDRRALRAGLASGQIDADLADRRPGREGQTALMQAAAAGQADTVSFLLDAGADPGLADAPTARPGFFVFLHSEADLHTVTETGGPMRRSALHHAVSAGRLRCAQRLLLAGAYVDADDYCGHTPLLVAAEAGDAANVSLLLDGGADIHAQNIDQRGALHLAAGNGHAEVVELLLACGAHRELWDAGSKGPLAAAAAGRHLAVLRLLLGAIGVV